MVCGQSMKRTLCVYSSIAKEKDFHYKQVPFASKLTLIFDTLSTYFSKFQECKICFSVKVKLNSNLALGTSNKGNGKYFSFSLRDISSFPSRIHQQVLWKLSSSKL